MFIETLKKLIYNQNFKQLMPTFSFSSLVSNKIKKLIATKPLLLTPEEITEAGSDINIVGYNPIATLVSDENKSFSPRLLNWVEPYLISGQYKTLFYTDVNSGLKVGDRVFIVNGNYDSGNLIKSDKYKKGRDGYKILKIDRCQLVLDIDYTGLLPWNNDGDDEFINVYYIRNNEDFKHANRSITTKNGIFDYKFNPYNNNIIYVDQDYPIPGDPAYVGWGENAGLTGSPGFYVKNGTYSWINITNDFISGSFSVALNPTYSVNRVKIHNYSFTYSIGVGVVEFKEDFVYKWDMADEPDAISGTYSTWVNDPIYNQAFITKGNFRDGTFKGVWNSGLYGTSNKRINWTGDGDWNGGTLLNTKWLTGTFNSKFTLSESYVTEFDSNGLPTQKVTGPNNNGKGYSFIVSSELVNSSVVSGSVLDSIIGSTPTYSLVGSYLTSTTQSYSNEIQSAYFENCRFLGGYVSNAEIKNTRAVDTYFNNIKSVNSNFRQSIIKNSTYLSDNIIKILGYDELNYAVINTVSGASHKVYKFYISKSSYDRLKLRDRFYFKGIKFNDNSKYPLNFFDKRFRLSTWTEYTDEISSTYSFYKRGVEVGAFLSTPEDNKYSYNNLALPLSTIIIGTNSNPNYSLDVVFTTYDKNNLSITGGLNFNTDTTSATPSSLGNIVDIENAYILDSDFESGIFESSNWNSGYHINYNNDVNITTDSFIGKYYNMIVATPSQSLIVTTTYDNLYPEAGESCLSVGNIVYLNAVDWDTSGRIDSITISSTGSGYSTSTGLTTSGGFGSGAIVDIISASGGLDNVTISFGGLGYQVGDALTVSAGGFDGVITVESVTGSVTRLPDAYLITNNTLGVLTLQEVITGSSSIIENLLSDGLAYTTDADNRYGYIYKSKFKNSKIKGGIFRRAYITKSLIENEDYSESDKDFNNLEGIKSLLISDTIFSNNDNILSKSTYLNSYFVGETDAQAGGIVYNSIWNGPTFSSGVFKDGTWIDGIFRNGTFYNSRSFNNNATSSYPYYWTDRVKSYYKYGETGLTLSNDRHSWQYGVFLNGEFYKSDWESGDFKGGRFYNSKFYSGTVSGGIIGDDALPSTDTQIFNAEIVYTTVENAAIYAKDTSNDAIIGANINWYNGVFNSGIFGSDITQASASNTAIWYDGVFNNGQFVSNGRWKKGIFNGGKFISGYGWTMSSSTSQSDYTWEDGTFNGGEFGNADLGTNSTWYQGDFNGGIFKGRVWNNGVFTSGEFQGSATYAAVGGYSVDGMTVSNAYNFVESYTQSYYGLWNNGYFTNVKDKFIKDQKIYTIQEKALARIPMKSAKFKNALWMSGTFSHPSGEFNTSVWLDGAFESGTFKSSSFNPWVLRSGATAPSFNLNDDLTTGSGSCIWYNGRFEDSDFYISQWNDGKWISGTGFGMIWKNGVANYMNAYNICWHNGTWRNGNWQGSYFNFDGCVEDSFNKQILFRVMNCTGTASMHVWNVFRSDPTISSTITNPTASTPSLRSLRRLF